MAATTNGQTGTGEDLEHQIRELWTGKEGVMDELRWLQETIDGKPRNNAKGETKEKGTGAKDEINTDINIKNVLDILGSTPRNNVDEKQLATHGRLRNTMTKILKCIETLGGMVAGAASTVFAPAPTCYSALSFVIQFWIKHEDMYEKLDELYERCSAFLGRLHTYRNSMTPRLQLVACKALHHVVKIFRHSVEIVKSKRKRMKELFKDGFLGDSDIKILLEKLEQLVGDEQGLLAAESFTELKEIAKTIATDDAQRRVAADGKLWKRSISTSLGLGEEGNELHPESKVALRNIEKSLVQGTGKWILDDSKFKSWIDGGVNPAHHSNDPSVIAVHGDGNTGKSFLATNVIKELEARHPRPVVGYFFYQRDPKQPLSDRKLRSKISRSILWQFATSQNAPTQTMAQASEEMGYNPDDIDIWRQLFLNIDPLKRRGKASRIQYYIVIDGLDDKDIGSVVPLLHEIAYPGEVRVLLTSKDDVVKHFAGEHELPCKTIELDTPIRPNLSDINLFILDRLDSMDALKVKGSHVSEYREKIRKEVQEKTSGDYLWISTVLSTLGSADRASEIDDILAQIKTTGANQIIDQISRLNKTLSRPRMKDLNAIVLWVVAAQELPSIAEMNAVLFLNFGSLSFIPLHQRLGPFLELNNAGRINFKSPEIKQIISAQKPKTSVTGTEAMLQDADTVHRFLQHVCPRRNYEMGELEKFLWGEGLQPKNGEIQYDEINSHIQIAITCLKCLTGSYDDIPEQLRIYSGDYLLYHLEQTRLPEKYDQDKEDTSQVEKRLVDEATVLLLNLFTSEEGIDSLFWTRAEHMSQHTWLTSEGEWLKRNRQRWLYGSGGVKELSRWLKNPLVAECASSSAQKGLIDEFVSNEDRQQEILLQFAAKRLAQHLLLEDTFTSREECTAIYFLHGYVSRIHLEGDQKRYEVCQEDRPELQLSEVLRIERWATSDAVFGKGVTESSIWQIQTAMIIGSMCGGDDKPSAQREKEIRTRKARELDPHNPMATLIVSRDIRSNSMVNEGPHPRAISSVHTEAFKMLEMATRDVMNILEREPTWVKSMSRSLLVASIFLDIAEFYWAEGERNKAAKKYKESLVYNSTRYTVYLTIVERYRQHGYWSDVIDFISALHAQCKPSYHFRYMDRFIHEFLADSKFQDALAQAAEETRSWPEANKLFFFAIGLAKESPAELFHAHKAYISFIKKGPSNKATELDVIKHSKLGLACGVPEAESGTGVLYRDIFAIADPLALIYLNKAMALLHERDMLTGKSNGVPPPPPMSLHKRDRLTGKISWVSPPPPMPMPPATPDTSKALTEFKNLLDEAVAYGQQIEMLVQDTDVWANASINCCLAWYYLKMGDLEASRKALAPLMAASIALLSDDDPSNDWFAILYLGRALTTLQDRKNAHMAWSILKFLLPDDIKDPLLVCRVCEESVRLGPGDVICTTCYGPVFKHEECHRNLPISDSIGCARGHGFMEIPRKEGQLDPTAVHTWNNQLRERYVLGRVPVKEEDLTPSALVKQGTVRIKSYAEVVAVKEETKPRWRNQSARMGAGPPAVPRSGYNAADISGVSAEAIQLGRKSERMGAMMTAGFSDWADAALGQQFYVTGMQEGFGRGPSPEIRREIFPELKRELQSTVRQRASNHVSAKEDGNWTKKDGKWIAISTLRK